MAKRTPFAGTQAVRTLDWGYNPGGGGSPTECWRRTAVPGGTTGQHRKGENRVFAGRGSGHPRVAGDRKPHKTSEESDRDCRKQETWARPPLGGPLAKAGVLPSTLFWVGGCYGIWMTFLRKYFFCFFPLSYFPFSCGVRAPRSGARVKIAELAERSEAYRFSNIVMVRDRRGAAGALQH